jgi:8-oxo-dGTP diphosphatase
MSKTVTCLDVESNKYEVPVDQLKWRPATYGVVVKDGKILLSKQFGDKYDLPGGGLDLGETPEEGVIREVKEETGIDVKNPKFIHMVNSYFYSDHALKEAYQCIMMYFICEYAGGKLSTEGFDEWEKQYAEMAEWLPLDQLDELGIASSVDYRPFIKEALK